MSTFASHHHALVTGLFISALEQRGYKLTLLANAAGDYIPVIETVIAGKPYLIQLQPKPEPESDVEKS